MTLEIVVGDLPHGAEVQLTFHGLFDSGERAGASKWDFQLALDRLEDGAPVEMAQVEFYDRPLLPVEVDWTGTGKADSFGVVRLQIAYRLCRGRPNYLPSCLLLPGSFLSAELIDPTPWAEAPACP
jgi:hypothetical protein